MAKSPAKQSCQNTQPKLGVPKRTGTKTKDKFHTTCTSKLPNKNIKDAAHFRNSFTHMDKTENAYNATINTHFEYTTTMARSQLPS